MFLRLLVPIFYQPVALAKVHAAMAFELLM